MRKKQNIRLVAMDLDGTLLDTTGKITPYTARILRACEKQGAMMVLSSGRGFESVRLIAREVGLSSPIICANGARVEESPDGPTCMEDCLPEAMSQDVCRIMHESGVYFVAYTRGVHYQVHMAGKQRGRVAEHADGDPAYTLRQSFNEEELWERGVKRAYKYVAFTEDLEALRKLRERLLQQTEASVTSSWWDNIEVLAPGAGKGRALRFLADHYGVAKAEIMAFGDQMNDLDMLREAEWSVAMENAVSQLKAEARLVAPSNAEEGVAKTLEEWILKGGINK